MQIKGQSHSLAVGHRMNVVRLLIRYCKMSLTNCLLQHNEVAQKEMQCHSQAVGHGMKDAMGLPDSKKNSMTHKLLVLR